MERKCIDCGDSINGRADKKFCSDQCRNSYNNRLNSTDTNFMRNVNNILRKNRRILGTLTPNGKSSIHKDKILDLGFNFSYFTHTYTTRKGAVYFSVMNSDTLLLAMIFFRSYIEKNRK